MKIAKNKTMATLIALFLVLTIAVTLVALPAANAHTPAWTIPTWAYLAAAPEVVGVGQQVTFVMFLTALPPGASYGNTIRWEGFKITLTKPNGATETIGPFTSDSTGTTYTLYTPDQVGNWTATLNFPAYTAGSVWGTYANDTFMASSYTTKFIVRQEPVPEEVVYPLPTEFWTRPIEGQNDQWYRVASNWLAGSHDVTPEGTGDDYFQMDGIAPNSGHIMWTKLFDPNGGVVGGTRTAFNGNAFYSGTQYNPRFDNPIIMCGRLYTDTPVGNSGSGGLYECINLITGETEWKLNTTGIGTPSFGYLYAEEDQNQHGEVPGGWLFTSNFGRAIFPGEGWAATLNITDVPSGTAVTGQLGEQLRVRITNIGNTTNPNWRLMQWNSSKCFTTSTSGRVNASTANRYDFNVSITGFGVGMSSASIQAVELGKLVLGRNGSLPSTTSQTSYTYWALSLKPESRGALLWMKTYSPPQYSFPSSIATATGSYNYTQLSESAAQGVYLISIKELMMWQAFDMTTGSLLWTSKPEVEPYGYFSETTGGMNTNSIAYGKFFAAGYSGCCYCYDLYNGTLLWKYESVANTRIFARHTTHILAIADNKVFLGTHEHSASTPLMKDNHVQAVDVNTGKLIWKLMGWGAAYSGAVADGYLVYFNCYDNQIYCVGKGPSGTTVEAPMTAVTAGDNVVIRGTVTDQSPGSKAKGTAAVSDASMGEWMAYKFMQKPIPTNTTGVEVTLDAVDPNGNFIHLGTATSDMSGTFGYMWTTPDVPGKYTIIATFAGSESYWPSYAETYTAVSEAPPATPPPPAAAPLPPFDMYILAATVAIIIAVAIATVLILRKRP